MNETILTLNAPSPFHFAHTAYSHGWAVLTPNAWDAERETLRRVQRLGSGAIVLLEAAASADATAVTVRVQHGDPLSTSERVEIETAVAHMLRLDEDFSEFYALCRERGEPWTRLTAGLGRLLRSPTVFEDVVKTICTTNIQWGGTKRMLNELVAAFGEPFPGDGARRAFPTPEAIAAVSPEEFATAVRMGYRAPYVHTLAQQVAAGDLDLEALHDPALPTAEVKQRLLALKGVGPYAAATLLMLLGHYDELAVDTVFRDHVSKTYFGGERPSDKEAQAIYADWGRWKYLAYWFDLWQGLNETV